MNISKNTVKVTKQNERRMGVLLSSSLPSYEEKQQSGKYIIIVFERTHFAMPSYDNR